MKHSVPWGSILGPVPFLLYIKDLSKSINGKFKTILFADDTCLLLTNSILLYFDNNVKNEFESLNK